MRLEMLHEDFDWKKFGRGVALGASMGAIGLGVTDALGKAKRAAPQKTVQTQAATKPVDKSKAEKHEFDIDAFTTRLIKFEGKRNYKFSVGKDGEIDIGVGHAMYNPRVANPTARSRQVFATLFPKLDFDSVLAGRVGLTDEQVRQLAAYDIKEHLDRAKRRFSEFDNWPQYFQEAVVDMIYRGDMWKKTAALIDEGNMRAAAKAYVDSREYRNAVANKMSGIVVRVNANAAAINKYAEQLGQ